LDSPVTDEPSNDSDAYGRAALLLVESLIHGLTARAVLSVGEAVAVMEIALDAQIAIAEDAAQATPSMRRTTVLLSTLVDSLKIDLPDDDGVSASETRV
jgi:hypothetical protein